MVCTITAIYYIESKRAEDNRVFLAIQAFCMIFNIARLVISSITKVNCGDSGDCAEYICSRNSLC